MSISLNKISQVTAEVLAAGNGGTTANGVLLSENAEIPLGVLLSFGNATDVGSYCGLTSVEYEAALVYFGGIDGMTQKPGTLYLMGYNAAAAAAYLRGGSLASLTLTQLQAISGVLTVTIDGTPATSSSFNLSTATSFANAATIIQAAFTSPNFTVTYDTQQSAFVITSTATGAATTATYATGTAASSLKLDSASGGVISLGANAQTPAGAMAQLLTLTKNWVTFTTSWEPTLTDKLAFSQWTSGQNSQYAYAGYDSDVNALTSGSTSTWLAEAIAAGYSGTIPSWGGAAGTANAAIFAAMLVMSWAASLNFNSAGGRTDLSQRSATAGLVPSVTTDAAYDALRANGYNFFGQFATNNAEDAFYYNGSVTGSFKWADTYINQIWLNSNIQASLLALLRAVGSIPYNSDGYAMIEETLAGGVGVTGGPIQQGLAFGAIRTDVPLSTSQVADLISNIGHDVSQQMAAQGYYLQIQAAAPSVRAARGTPPMTLWYADGGSIQELNLASVTVQ